MSSEASARAAYLQKYLQPTKTQVAADTEDVTSRNRKRKRRKKDTTTRKHRKSRSSTSSVRVIDEDLSVNAARSDEEEEEEDDNEMLAADAASVAMLSASARAAFPPSSGGFASIVPARSTDMQDLSPPRRARPVRQDSDSDDDLSPPRRVRHDSDAEEDLSPPRRARRVRHDSDSNDEDLSPPRRARRARHDSDAEEEDPRCNTPPSTTTPSMTTHTSKSNRSSTAPATTAVADVGGSRLAVDQGVQAGLFTKDMIRAEAARKRAEEERRLASLNADEMGRNAETVFRDRKGRRLETLEALVRQEKGIFKKEEESKMEWGKGLVKQTKQLTEQEKLKREMEGSFARTRDDEQLNQQWKQTDRWGDPLAGLLPKDDEESDDDIGLDGKKKKKKKDKKHKKKKDKKHKKKKKPKKPKVYMGQPWPNRYNIAPGYQWDGVDRSNGFEKRVFLAQNQKKQSQLNAYRWSTTDM